MMTTRKQVRFLRPGDVLPRALKSGPLRVTKVEIHQRAANGSTHASEYLISAEWIAPGTKWDGTPIAGLLALGNSTVEVQAAEDPR